MEGNFFILYIYQLGKGIMEKASQSAASLRAFIIEFRSEIEEQRKLPIPVVRELQKYQLYRLHVAKAQGGLEISPVEALKVYENLAQADASVAWCVWNSSLPSFFGRYLKEDVREKIFADSQLKYASSSRPTGKATKVDGHYNITGRWSMVSGCMHADWVALMCVVYKNGEMCMMEEGVPEMRMVYLKKGSYEIKDTWFVGGLRGTGSHDLVVEGVSVPDEYTFTPADPVLLDSPTGRLPITSTMSCGHAAICLGIAQSSLDSVITLAKSKVSVDPVPKMPDRASNQSAVAEAGAKLKALRSHLHFSLGQIWDKCSTGKSISSLDLAETWSAAITTARECRNMVSILYEISGATAVYESFSLERSHRDIHAAMQHVVAQRFWLEEAGKVEFGMESTNPLFAI